MYVPAEGDITSAGLLLEKGANGKYYLIAPHIEDPDEQGMYIHRHPLLWIQGGSLNTHQSSYPQKYP